MTRKLSSFYGNTSFKRKYISINKVILKFTKYKGQKYLDLTSPIHICFRKLEYNRKVILHGISSSNTHTYKHYSEGVRVQSKVAIKPNEYLPWD